MPTYKAGLCRMVNGVVQAPYDGKSFEAKDDPEAIQKAKEWARSDAVDVVLNNAWLQVLSESGRSIGSFKPGWF